MPRDPLFFHYEAAAVADADRTWSPGAILLSADESWSVGSGASRVAGGQRVVAVGSPADVRAHEAFGSPREVASFRLPRMVLMPGLVNAHSHLDLTHIGPRPHDAVAGFGGFVDLVRRERRSEAALIAESVAKGVELSLAGGVVAVGDVSGAVGGRASGLPAAALRGSGGLCGQSFVEFFAIGRGGARGLEGLDAALREMSGWSGGSLRVGISPHAPGTVGLVWFAAAVERAARLGARLMTHLAETADEREFIAHARGPHREFLERLGLWDDAMLGEIGLGRSPVQHIAPALRAAAEAGRPMLVAHVNDADDADVATLAATGASVAYCPRASEYFGAERVFGPHRYREMMAAGVRVVLGTDSVINLPAEGDAGRVSRISVWDEMRRLHERDGVDGRTLLRMCTVDAAAALGLDADEFVFREGGRPRGVVAAPIGRGDPLGDAVGLALRHGGAAHLLG